VRLTDAGFAFREYAQTIMDTVDAARECLSDIHTRLRLRVTCGPVGQYVLLPSVLRKLAAEYPDFELEVSELTTEQQMSRLPEGKIDALLMVTALPVAGLRFDPICKEPLVAMVSRHSPLAAKPCVSVEDLRSTSIIASRLKDCRFHQPFLHSLLAPYGITPKIVESPQSCSVQFAYAAAGEGMAIATESMTVCAFPDVVALPFEEPMPAMQLGLASMAANETRAMTIFRNVVMECARSELRRKQQASMKARRAQHLSMPVVDIASHAEAS
jgi:DNA-binding transcriptional LysR family regulator